MKHFSFEPAGLLSFDRFFPNTATMRVKNGWPMCFDRPFFLRNIGLVRHITQGGNVRAQT